jgi:hypothetical protein
MGEGAMLKRVLALSGLLVVVLLSLAALADDPRLTFGSPGSSGTLYARGSDAFERGQGWPYSPGEGYAPTFLVKLAAACLYGRAHEGYGVRR